MEDELLRVLAKYGYVGRNSPVFIQSSEDTNLMDLKKKTDIRLIQLISGSSMTVPFGNMYSYGDMITNAGSARVASYAYGIGRSRPGSCRSRPGSPRICPCAGRAQPA